MSVEAAFAVGVRDVLVAAAAMLAMRAGDGHAGPLVTPFVSSGEPGRFRPMIGPDAPLGLTGLAALQGLGNLDPSTPGDPTWDVLSGTVPVTGGTPPMPEYSSAHATVGSAGGEAIKANVPGRVAWSMTSPTSQTGRPRSWRSIDEAIRENGDSRVYVGFHFRTAVDVGQGLGREIARWVVTHSLAPVEDGG